MTFRPRVVAALLTVCALAACSESSGGASQEDKGDGVAAGATMAQYKEAFADIDPITIVAQTSGPKGSFAGAKEEAYLDAIEEWSDGKITFDTSYSKAIAPVTEEDDALADGRLDLAMTTVAVEPDKFPAYSSFIGASARTAESLPLLAPMHALSYMQEVGYGIPEVQEEFSKNGMHLLIPSTNFVPQVVLCQDAKPRLDDWDGVVAVSQSPAISTHLKALGAQPTTMAWTEVFEGLQRGVVECAASSLPNVSTLGISELTPYAMLSSAATWGNASGGLGMSKAKWDGLPLVAKQLFHDRLDVYVGVLAKGLINATAEVMADLKKAGGGVVEMDDESGAIMKAEDDKLLDGIASSKAYADPKAAAALVESSSAAWLDKLKAMDYDSDMEYDDLQAYWADNKDSFDIDPYVDLVRTEILDKHRPS